MNPTEIEFALRALVSKPYDSETFPYDLIAIFNASKMTVARLKSGTTNKAILPGDVLWQKQLFFRPAHPGEDVGATGDVLVADALTARHKPRFIVTTNGQQVHLRDLKFQETVNVEFDRLDEESYFLLPLAGYERRAIVEEHPADIRAAKKLKKLYDAILAANSTWSSGHHSHELNLLMTRLLFCFYAEDTGIFESPQIFTNTVMQLTCEDGSDVAPLLDRLFRIMNLEDAARPSDTPAVDTRFPYVNGSLFEDSVELPQFSRTARRQLLECGELDWTTITPDIFGSMIQTIAQDTTRGDLGMHYTSVPNILNVLDPLFLESLRSDFEKANDSVPRLDALLRRLSAIRVFDPACGSGNFLIVAYKEMRELEIAVLKRIGDLTKNQPLRLSGIPLDHFFGTDVVDFACETARLSLWIAEHQMNTRFKETFGTSKPTLPLAKIKTIQRENATRIDWSSICPPTRGAEIYVCGNPPYQGSSNQTVQQKQDVDAVFGTLTKTYKNIDYVGCFFVKAASYIRAASATCAFVATNSICQGEQVGILWPIVFSNNVEIIFARPSFRWQNNAANNAFVFCVIVGLAHAGLTKRKTLYTDGLSQDVSLIGPYLIAGTDSIVEKAAEPTNALPKMLRGNMPTDGGHLILAPGERARILAQYPNATALLRRYYGSEDFINGIERWCLWITDKDLPAAMQIPPIRARIEAVRGSRLKSKAPTTVEYAEWPHRFRQIQAWGKPAIIVPGIFSERRTYQSIGILPATAIISNTAFAIYDPPAFLLALLSSMM
ncbi:MAG TPA: DNA methyltransferase, partial [Candidatus Cybelea sp.]|nr:DNA methyltransferase [Candidatus Cybelea sp.]